MIIRSKWFQASLALLAIIFAGLLHVRSGRQSPSFRENFLPDRFIVVLGIVQDAGYPQLGCTGKCCQDFRAGKEMKKLITCLALVDRNAGKYWLFEATPDMGKQLDLLQSYVAVNDDYSPDGIFITHAHTGHYTGLMHLGREAMAASRIPVFVLPRMDSFLRQNGPWSQLVNLENISLQSVHTDSTVQLGKELSVTPFRVPHRDEYSETAGYSIRSGNKKILFIPDIDKWEKWEKDMSEEIKNCDVALIDGTFFRNGELPGRDMKEVPHPFVQESLEKFSRLTSEQKNKVVFIHFNHTNPLLRSRSAEKDSVRMAGFRVAEEGMIISL